MPICKKIIGLPSGAVFNSFTQSVPIWLGIVYETFPTTNKPNSCVSVVIVN